MSIENLPTELIILITSLLPCESSLAALALANRRLYAVCNPCLYQYNVLHGNSSALNWAAENDRIDTLQKALDAGAPLLTEQPSGEDRSILFGPHPISLAARMGHTNIVKFMIDRGVSSNITAPGFLTPLGLAAGAGHASLVKYLLQAGARQGIENALGHRPVYLAAFEGHKDVVEVLLSDTKGHGDKPNKAELMTEALFAGARAGHVSLIQLLLTHGAQVNVARFGRSPLTVAAGNGDSELVSLLVVHGADPNFVVDPLTVAVIKRHEEIVPMLIPGTANLHRTRALAIAVSQGKRQIAEMLLLSGAHHHFCPSEIPSLSNDSSGDREEWVQPLLFAVQSGNLGLVQLLLEYGADVNVECSEHPGRGMDKDFDHVLFWAVEGSEETIVNLILESGADPEITDVFGQPPLSYAVYSKCEAVIRCLLDHGANPYRAVDHSGKKLIMFWQMEQSTWAMLQEAEVKWTEQHPC